MNTSFVSMGEYYRNAHGLVKTVCRGRNVKDDAMMIGYVNVQAGGIASEIYFMDEEEFKKSFLS